MGDYGAVYDGGDSSKVQTQLAADVRSISSTNAAFAVLKADRSVVTWGAGGGKEDDGDDVPDSGGDCSKVKEQLDADGGVEGWVSFIFGNKPMLISEGLHLNDMKRK